jgi:hypothetical protein
MGKDTRKIYCYVDESGQDARSDFFVVVSIVSHDDQQVLRGKLLKLERESGLGQKKWRGSRSPERESFLLEVAEKNIAAESIYYGYYKKPLVYPAALLESLSLAIQIAAPKDYRSTVYVDGITEVSARQLTSGLRLMGIKADHVRTVRDESEPVIRLADRWAGCIRASLDGNPRNIKIVENVTGKNYLKLLSMQKIPRGILG